MNSAKQSEPTCPECGSIKSSHYYREDGAVIVYFFCGARTRRAFSTVKVELLKSCKDYGAEWDRGILNVI